MKSIAAESINQTVAQRSTESDYEAMERATNRRMFLFAGGAAVAALVGGTVAAKGLIALGHRYDFGFSSNGRPDRPAERRGMVRTN